MTFSRLTDADLPVPNEIQQQFLRLLSMSYRPVYSYILTLVPFHSDAEDVMQEVCLVLWSRFEEFDPTTNFRQWACAIAFNIAKAYVRRQRRQQGIGLSEETIRDLSQIRGHASELLELRRERLAECFSALPKSDQAMLHNFYAGQSATEIAHQKDKSIHTVYDRLKKLRRRLFDCVNRRMGVEP